MNIIFVFISNCIDFVFYSSKGRGVEIFGPLGAEKATNLDTVRALALAELGDESNTGTNIVQIVQKVGDYIYFH